MVSNCPGCQIVRGVKLFGVKLSGAKLSTVSNCPRCQIVLVSNCHPTQIAKNRQEEKKGKLMYFKVAKKKLLKIGRRQRVIGRVMEESIRPRSPHCWEITLELLTADA